MAIDSLRDGFVRMCFDPSLNTVGGDGCRIVIEGFQGPGGGGTASAQTLHRVPSADAIPGMFGDRSQIGAALELAFRCCGNRNIEIMAIPRVTGPGNGTRAVYDWEVTGTATGPGVIDIYVGNGAWNFSVNVAEGDTEVDVMNAIVAEWNLRNPQAPIDIFAAAPLGPGGFRVRPTFFSVDGNGLNMMVDWTGRANRMPPGITVTDLGQSTIGLGGVTTQSNYPVIYRDCCVCCHILLHDEAASRTTLHNYLMDQWSCDKPQCFGHGYTYRRGTLGQVLAADMNSPVLSILGTCNTDPIWGWLQTAAYGIQSCCFTHDNPEISIQGPNFGVLECVTGPASCRSCYSFEQRNQLFEAGIVTTVPTTTGGGQMYSPQIVADITNNRLDDEGRENLTFQSVSSRRLAVQTAITFSEQLQQYNGLGYFTAATAIREGTRGINSRIILSQVRAWARTQVGVLFSEFDNLDADITIQDDFERAPRCQGVPGKIYVNMIYRPPVRIASINVNAQPALLSNC